LNKYTNAFKGYQTRYFVLDSQAKSLLYFMPDEVRKKGPRGVIELTDCWITPSNEDDVTFTVQTGGGEAFKLRASDAKVRQKWIDRLRISSGANAADIYVSSLPTPKHYLTNTSSLTNPPSDTYPPRSPNRRDSFAQHHQQTLKDLKEVIRCVEVSQREFVETIESLPDNAPQNSLSKDMLLLRAISQSCIGSLQESLTILTRRRTPDTEIPPIAISCTPSPSPQPLTNLSGKQLSQSFNSTTGGKSSLTVGGLSPHSGSYTSLNKTSSLGGLNQQSFNDHLLSVKNTRAGNNILNRSSESSQ